MVTEAGALLLERARAVLADLDRLKDELVHLQSGRPGNVSIAVSSLLVSAVLPNTLRKFREKMPQVQVNIAEAVDSADLVSGIREGKFDFVVMQTPREFFPPSGDIEQLVDVRFPLILGCRAAHPLAHARSIRELNETEWIFPATDDTTTPLIEQELSRYGMGTQKHNIRCRSNAIALDLIEASDLVGIFVEKTSDIIFRRYGLVQIPISENLPDLHAGIFQRNGKIPTTASALMLRIFLQDFKDFAAELPVERGDGQGG
jgi:DNA-binding transcriptional LysR family regulator